MNQVILNLMLRWLGIRNNIAAAATQQLIRAGQNRDWYNPGQDQQFQDHANTVASAARQQIADVTGAYWDLLLQQLGGHVPDTAPPVPPTDQPNRFGQIGSTYRYAISQGQAEAEAIQRSNLKINEAIDREISQVAEAVQTDVLTRSEQEAGPGDSKIIGYRRVIHPELSTSGVCGMCVVAADRIYDSDQLNKIHTNCNCGVLPVYEGFEDYGWQLNVDDLNALYKAAGGTQIKQLSKIRIAGLTDQGRLGRFRARSGTTWPGNSSGRAQPDPRKPVTGPTRSLLDIIAEHEPPDSQPRQGDANPQPDTGAS